MQQRMQLVDSNFCCRWSGCSSSGTVLHSRAELVAHVESVHVHSDSNSSPYPHDGDDDDDDAEMDTVSKRRRRRRRGWRSGHGRALQGAFHCGWINCYRRSQPFNARYKLLIHTRIHTGHKPHNCSVRSTFFALLYNHCCRVHVDSLSVWMLVTQNRRTRYLQFHLLDKTGRLTGCNWRINWTIFSLILIVFNTFSISIKKNSEIRSYSSKKLVYCSLVLTMFFRSSSWTSVTSN